VWNKGKPCKSSQCSHLQRYSHSADLPTHTSYLEVPRYWPTTFNLIRRVMEWCHYLCYRAVYCLCYGVDIPVLCSTILPVNLYHTSAHKGTCYPYIRTVRDIHLIQSRKHMNHKSFHSHMLSPICVAFAVSDQMLRVRWSWVYRRHHWRATAREYAWGYISCLRNSQQQQCGCALAGQLWPVRKHAELYVPSQSWHRHL
jgi:hypothetical protein